MTEEEKENLSDHLSALEYAEIDEAFRADLAGIIIDGISKKYGKNSSEADDFMTYLYK